MARLFKRRQGIALILSLLLLVAGFAMSPSRAHAESAITLDSPAAGAAVSGGIVQVSGTYSGVYDVVLYINGTDQEPVRMDDPDGDDAGTWSYELDASAYNGGIELTARGLDTATRYGVWSPTVALQVDNPSASVPEVTITSPAEGVSLRGMVWVEVQAASALPVSHVQIRLNHGEWQEAKRSGTKYVYGWNTAQVGNRTVSLEARASNAAGRYGYSSTVYAKVGQGTNEPFRMQNQDRAMWVWEPESYKLLLNPGSRSVLESFVRDTQTFGSDPVTTLYLAVGSYAGYEALEGQAGQLKSFIRWAHGKNLQVYALIAGGTTPPYMGAYERYHPLAVREIEQIINYNLAAATDEKFDGVNVDIEPYISPDFKDPSKFLQTEYLDVLQKMIDRRDAAGINLPFGPAIPKWFDSSDQGADIAWNGSTKWLSEHIQDITDYISIMDYRDTADGGAGIIAGAQGEIAYAERIGKPNSVVIGVETSDIADSGDPETITFQEEGRGQLETELDKVYAAFGASSAFGGIAVHHYDSYRTLPSFWGEGSVAWTPPADTEAPSAVRSGPVAAAVDYQTVNLGYGMATDNSEVDRYIIYRGTTPGFTPTAANIAGLSRSLSFQDTGLLPNTTYYYKVAARDLRGNIGPVSAEASATTGNTDLLPLIVKGMNVGYASTKASVKLTVADYATGEPLVGASAEGRFTYSGGRYAAGKTGPDGTVSLDSEGIPAGRQIGFEPRRIVVPGYYHASAYDQPYTTALVPFTGLSGLSASAGTWDAPFETGRTRYTLTVPASVNELAVTPVAVSGSSVVTVNGSPTASGTASVPVSIGTGPAAVNILVYNADGTTDAYQLQVARSESANS
ncbi:Ig-like domain-containing protein [Cohnella zeiphila]|nr:Ig-like domain-containing protein [Cohnella zeiphila]